MTRPFILLCATLVATLPVFAGTADCPEVPRAPLSTGETPRIEIVFVLDATGSMGGLIEGAKTKIWSIVNAIARARPTPELRIGIVAYRDRGDAFVTRRTPLAHDLDATYAWLIDQRAEGGGDGPESVRQALNEAVERFEWSGEGTRTLRLIYLVGDAPPHVDYPEDVPETETAARAKHEGIVIHTIQCGDWPETRTAWERIASTAGGASFRIEQSGGMTARTTPYDAELARHARLLERTVVPYGDGEKQRAETRRRIEDGATAEALAERASFVASDLERRVEGRDLVQLVLSGRLGVDEVRREQLPEPLRSMEPAALRRYIEQLAEHRRGLREEVAWLTAQRRTELARDEGTEGAFDRRVIESLRCAAARIGLVFDDSDF